MAVQSRSPVEQQIETYRPTLLLYCQRLTGSKWDAEDLVQDTFLKAWSLLAGPHENTQALLFRIAKNAWIDKCRKRKRANECALSEGMLAEAESTDPADSGLLLDAMTRLLHALSPLQTAVLLLRDVFEYSNLEVAHLIGTTEGAVKSLVHRARRNLQDGVAEEQLQTDHVLLNAYMEAFRTADAAGLVALAQNNVIHPVHALNSLWMSNRKQQAHATQPAQMLMCA